MKRIAPLAAREHVITRLAIECIAPLAARERVIATTTVKPVMAAIARYRVPAAIAVVAVGPVLGALLVMRYAPETKGLTLEEVQEQLA